jgi:6-phosphofructokinase 1
MKVKTLAILASGGDAPGMNAAIRAATKTAIGKGIRMLGVERGFCGLVDDKLRELDSDSIRNIIQRGGAIIHSSRCDEFKTAKGRKRALETCARNKIDGLILLGGDGTMRGAVEFEKDGGPPAVGIPTTIDNDIEGTDFTIGFDSAVNTALRAIDQIRDTAETMEALFFIETMGRHSGAIALAAGIGGGGNVVIVPEKKTNIAAVAKRLVDERKAGASSLLVIVAEGDDSGGAYKIAEKVKKLTGMDYRVTILGHVQRGGNPTAQDRIIATVLGVQSVEDLIAMRHGHLIGWKNKRIVRIPFAEARTSTTALAEDILHHAATMLM